jgi:hypothetical protein
MKMMIRRLRRLEALSTLTADGRPRETLRVVVRCVCGPSRLETSKCTRMLGRNGLLIEVVELDGGLEGLTDEDLARFITSFPVEAA